MLIEEFDRIIIEEVRSRIVKIPWRYRILVEIGGKRIKLAL